MDGSICPFSKNSWAPAVSMAPGWDIEDGGGRGTEVPWAGLHSLAVRGSGLILELNLGRWGFRPPAASGRCGGPWVAPCRQTGALCT